MKGCKPRGRPSSAHTSDNVERVIDVIWRSPHRSARKQALALRLKGSSFGRIVKKDFHFHPHKIQVAQVLSEWDKMSTQQYCYEFLVLVNNSRNIGNTLLMSEEVLPYVWLCK